MFNCTSKRIVKIMFYTIRILTRLNVIYDNYR